MGACGAWGFFMRKLLSTLAVAALMCGYAAGASADEGWYGRADVGYSMDGEFELGFEDNESEQFESIAVDLDDDWMFDAGIGYAFANPFRVEAELARRANEVVGFPEAQVIADSIMLNGFFDFNRGGTLSPYVGLGAGYAKVNVEGLDDENWAWQALAGVGVRLRERVTLDIGYRYFNVDELEAAPIADAEYTHEAVTLGLRYQFAPPPAPAAAPAPVPVAADPAPVTTRAVCPTSDFVVYFEWDRSNLNTEALATIDQAVARARQCNVSAVAIVGHTDTSGSAAYNQDLSEARASVVRDALVARGLTADVSAMQGRGESELARPTSDGVREPLNRRTAVTIMFN
jgi:OmpA-OmpF porin, OOP family